jgi:hypothetical protein
MKAGDPFEQDIEPDVSDGLVLRRRFRFKKNEKINRYNPRTVRR